MTTPANELNYAGLAIHGLWRDQNDERHISQVQPNGQIKLYCTRGRDIRKLIRSDHYKAANEVLADDAVEQAVSLLDSMCELEGNDLSLGVRVAWLDKKTIAIDSISSTYAITQDGWDERLLSTPLFRRYGSMKPLASPVRGGDIRNVFSFINIKDELDQILFLTHMVYTFVPDIPHPPMVLSGPQGASKSTGMKMYLSIVDPNAISDIHTYSEVEFQLAAIQRWAIGLDNISGISHKFSDTLCKIVTGMGFARRILYTTDDMMTCKYMRVVLINGVSLPVDKPDLMDRCLLIALDRIDNSVRKDETTLMNDFDLVRGEILGGCFDALSKAMRLLPTVPNEYNTRMTDYAKWGCAIAEALGYERSKFLAALDRNTLRQNEESLDASPIAAVLCFCFSKSNLSSLKGTATDILRELRARAEGAGIDVRMLPQTPRILGKKLMEIKPNLEADGYKVFFNRGKERIWTIEPPKKLQDEYRASLASSTSSGAVVFPARTQIVSS